MENEDGVVPSLYTLLAAELLQFKNNPFQYSLEREWLQICTFCTPHARLITSCLCLCQLSIPSLEWQLYIIWPCGGAPAGFFVESESLSSQFERQSGRVRLRLHRTCEACAAPQECRFLESGWISLVDDQFPDGPPNQKTLSCLPSQWARDRLDIYVRFPLGLRSAVQEYQQLRARVLQSPIVPIFHRLSRLPKFG